MNRRDLLKTGAAAITGLLRPAPATPRERTMRIVFGFDGSESMYTGSTALGGGITKQNAEIQYEGHVIALRSERVLRALVLKKPMIHCVTWAGSYDWTREFVPPRQVASYDDVDVLCKEIESSQYAIAAPAFMSGTSHSSLLSFVRRVIEPADSSVLDVSTDEAVKQEEEECERERDTLEKLGWVVNALVVGDGDGRKKQSMKARVVSRTGRVWQVQNWADYATALEEKMFNELIS